MSISHGGIFDLDLIFLFYFAISIAKIIDGNNNHNKLDLYSSLRARRCLRALHKEESKAEPGGGRKGDQKHSNS